MFSIVEFLKDQSVQLVPSSWVDSLNNKCSWPDGPATSLIKKCKPADQTWKQFQIRLLRTTDSYEKGKRVEKKAAAGESGLDTTDIDSTIVKRRRTQNPKYFSTRKPQPKPKPTPPEDSSDESLISVASDHHGIPPDFVFSEDEIRAVGPSQGELLDLDRNTVYQPHTPTTDQQIQVAQRTTPVSRIEPGVSAGPSPSSAIDYIKQSVTSLIRRQIEFEKTTTRTLAALKSDISELLRRDLTHINQHTSRLVDCIPIKLPVDTTDDLDALEDWIKNIENHNSLVTYCASIGGCNPSKVVRGILGSLISPCVARTINYTGTGSGQKRGFKDLGLKGVVDDATRWNRVASNSTIDEIKIVTSNWFQNSRDLGGGRSTRGKKNVVRTEQEAPN